MAHDVNIIVLAGGKSSRMGEDKGLIAVNGKPVISYILDTCRLMSDEITIVSNSEIYRQFGFPVVSDLIKDIGPLGGIYTGLFHSTKKNNIVLSCDTPLISVNILESLIKEKTDLQDVVIGQYRDQIQPLVGLYDKRILPIIERLIERKEFKMSQVYHNCHSKVLNLNHIHEKEFLNLNTRKDLKIFKGILNDS